MDSESEDFKQLAENNIRYFEMVNQEFGSHEKWVTGATLARQWLRLMNSESVSASEVAVLLTTVDENRRKYHLHSGWHIFALDIHRWAISNGFPGLKTFPP